MDIVGIYDAIEQISLNTGMISDVFLLKSENDVNNYMKNAKYRALFLVAKTADIQSENDFNMDAIIIDKTTRDNSAFLQSINDGLSVLRTVRDKIYNSYGQRIVYSPAEIGSEDDENGVLTTINTNISFEFDTLSEY